jgi:hypothetical protein
MGRVLLAVAVAVVASAALARTVLGEEVTDLHGT